MPYTKLREDEYHGIVLSDKDPKNQGRYKVHIPELMPLIEETKGIWVKNHIHKWRYASSESYFFGEYKPLHPGILVLVKFYEDDLNTGYIDRLISDQIIKTMPKIAVNKEPKSINERDDIYLIYKTPKKSNMFLILEETTDKETGLDEKLIPNSIHQYYNENRTTIIINEDGYHLFTEDNKGTTIEKDNNEWIKGNEKKFIEKNKHSKVKGKEYKYSSKGNYNISKGEIVNYSPKNITKCDEVMSFDSPMIYLNCDYEGTYISEEELKEMEALENSGENEIEVQNKIIQKTKPDEEDRPDLSIKENT